MAFGAKARDPSRPYIVYSLAWRDRVFYVGVAGADGTRHTHRWSFVENLVRHERAGTLKPGKRRELERLSNSVIASLIRADLEPLSVQVLWHGVGRAAALVAEKQHVESQLQAGSVLANIQGVPVRRTVAEVLAYLGVTGAGLPFVAPDGLQRAAPASVRG